jgi:GntR family transcriptional regulator
VTGPLQPIDSLAVDDPEPKWVRVAERIIQDIERGALRIGSRLPSERDLCVQLEVSRVTLRRAFASLEGQGVLRPSRGRGWFVAGRVMRDWPGRVESFVGAAHRLGLETTAELVRTSVDPAGTADAEAFGARPGDPITTFVRQRVLDGEPSALEVIRLVQAAVPEGLADEGDDQRFMVVLAEAGFGITGASATVAAIAAGPDHVRWLGVELGSALTEMKVEIAAAGRLVVESRLQYPPQYPLRVWFD